MIFACADNKLMILGGVELKAPESHIWRLAAVETIANETIARIRKDSNVQFVLHLKIITQNCYLCQYEFFYLFRDAKNSTFSWKANPAFRAE